jgi:hypothetical protein
MSAILGFLTAASILLALPRARTRLRFYLWASLAALPAEWSAHYLYGDWSWQYAATYVAVTLPILVAVALIVWEHIRKGPYRLRAIASCFILAAVLGRMTYGGIGRQITYFDWINLSLGVALATAGLLVGFTAAYSKRWDLGLILAVFWTSQAASSFGWTLHLWESLNWIIDPSLGIAAFLLLRWRLAFNPS